MKRTRQGPKGSVLMPSALVHTRAHPESALSHRLQDHAPPLTPAHLIPFPTKNSLTCWAKNRTIRPADWAWTGSLQHEGLNLAALWTTVYCKNPFFLASVSHLHIGHHVPSPSLPPKATVERNECKDKKTRRASRRKRLN